MTQLLQHAAVILTDFSVGYFDLLSLANQVSGSRKYVTETTNAKTLNKERSHFLYISIFKKRLELFYKYVNRFRRLVTMEIVPTWQISPLLWT